MCMTKEMATKLGEVIEKIKEVETNAAGEYFEQFLRLRIIANVTKLLKKIIELEKEGKKMKRTCPCVSCMNDCQIFTFIVRE